MIKAIYIPLCAVEQPHTICFFLLAVYLKMLSECSYSCGAVKVFYSYQC